MSMTDRIIRKIKRERDLGHMISSQIGLDDIDPAIKDRKVRTNVILINLPSYILRINAWHNVETSNGILTIQKR